MASQTVTYVPGPCVTHVSGPYRASRPYQKLDHLTALGFGFIRVRSRADRIEITTEHAARVHFRV
jgi:hypothetical protein